MSAGLFDRQPPKPQARPLLQFKAGKMSMKEDHSVQPDSRKGCAYLYQTTGDQSVHFCWFDRRTGLIEENFVLTPREAEFKRVPQCKSGRVYVLKLKEQQRRFFLWMQEPNASNDSQICETVNKFINSPPTPPSASGTSRSSRMVDLFSGVRGLSNLSQSELLALLSMGVGLNSGLSSESDSSAQVLPLPTGGHPNASRVEAPTMHTASATSVPTVTAPSSEQPARLRLQDLHSILSSIETPAQQPHIDLTLGFNSECVRDLVQEDPATAERLAAHLPPIDPEDRQLSPADNVLTNLRSPQFKSALKTFSEAFRSGQLGPAMSQFGLDQEATKAANSGDLEAFATALEMAVSKAKNEVESSAEKEDKKEKKDDENDGGNANKMDTS
uniref:RPN13_C domain-containing protein n=1 Tax=Mesocestoides corti TaxID=53468 RepID=A0A5K3EUN3_MESCO